MALTTNSKVWKALFGVFILITVFILLALYFNVIFISFVMGMILIVFTEQLIYEYRHKFDEKKISPWKRKVYSISIFIFWSIMIIFLFWVAIGDLTETISIIRGSNVTLSQAVNEKVTPFLPKLISDNGFIDNGIDYSEDYLINILTIMAREVTAFILIAVLIIPIMFYMYFRKRKELMNSIFDLLPKNIHNPFLRASKDISKQMKEFLGGKVIESIVVGVICVLGFYIIGVKGWLFFGVFAGLLNIIPYIGPFLGAIPPIIVTLLIEEPIIVLGVIITIIIAQLVDNLYLIPFMLSGKVRIHPLISIIFILIGAQLFGAIGMIFAIPIYLVYKIILKESYQALVEIYDK